MLYCNSFVLKIDIKTLALLGNRVEFTWRGIMDDRIRKNNFFIVVKGKRILFFLIKPLRLHYIRY